jgi:hypothetical protein
MKRWFDKYGSFDEEDVLKLISKRFDNYARGRSNSGSSGGSSYHQSGSDELYKELAGLIEMIEDFFAEKGLDVRSFLESQRRNR